MVQTGYPGGCGTPAYIEATASSPESSRVTCGASVSQYPINANRVVIPKAIQSIFRKRGGSLILPGGGDPLAGTGPLAVGVPALAGGALGSGFWSGFFGILLLISA